MRLKQRKRAFDEIDEAIQHTDLRVGFVPLCGVSERPLRIRCPMCTLVMEFNGTKHFCPDCGIVEE